MKERKRRKKIESFTQLKRNCERAENERFGKVNKNQKFVCERVKAMFGEKEERYEVKESIY